MKIKLIFSLAKAAKKNGGDKYETSTDEEIFSIYFPQSISRDKSNKPKKTLIVTVTDEK